MTAQKTIRGRPAIGPEFALHLPPDLRRRLDAAARRVNTTTAGVIRQILTEYLSGITLTDPSNPPAEQGLSEPCSAGKVG